MNTMEPIRDIEKVYDIADYLKCRNIRDYVMFLFGIYTGLRVSDILKFRVRDVKDKNYVYIREQKTDKEKRFPIHDELKEVLEEYIKDKKEYEYLFKSGKGKNQPISREHAYRILKKAANTFGMECIGTHTMRKTFGYHAYEETKDAVTLKEIFNHSDISTTLRYIGVNQDKKDDVMRKVSFLNKKKRK